MASASVSPELEDFWKTLWHVDVFKDHGDISYDQTVINEFLADSTYKTTQRFGDKFISTQGASASRNGGGGNMIYYEDLFEYLTLKPLAAVFSKEVGKPAETITLRESLVGKEISYDIKAFDFKDGKGLKEFITDSVYLSVDTTSHLEDMLSSYKSAGGPADKMMYYAYTREIESDPALKPTYDKLKSTGTSNLFYYELPAPENPTIIAYPKFSQQDKMSYFYCKYPVFLRNDGMKKNKKLKVQLSYVDKTGTPVLVAQGANTAGAIQKFEACLKNVVGKQPDDVSKELVFISKHHGDVAQTMVKFRDVRLESIETKQRIISNAFSAAFVSIDVNAITKALTLDVPYILMYTPDKKRIIAWKKLAELSEEEKLNIARRKLENERVITQNLFDRMETQIEVYNTKLETGVISRLIDTFQVFATRLLENPFKEGASASSYREVLREGIQIAVLASFLPQKDEFQNIDIPEGLSKDIIIAAPAISELKDIQKQLTTIITKTNSLIQYLDNLPDKLFSKDRAGNLTGLAHVSLQNDTILEFVKSGVKLELKRDKIYFTDSLNTITLQYDKGDVSFDTLLCRSGTKLNTMWGFDIIYFCWIRLNSLNVPIATRFIEKLRTIAINIRQEDPRKPNKIETFEFGLGIVGIGLTSPSLAETFPVIGGTQTQVLVETKVESPKTKTKILRLKAPTKEPLEQYFSDVVQALDDMIHHLRFILDLTYLYNYQTKIPHTTFQKLGFSTLNTFISKTFGEKYQVTPSLIAALAAEERASKRGGVYESRFKELIKEAIGFKLTKLPEDAEKVPMFGTKANEKPAGVVSTFSVLPYYEQTAEVISKKIQRETVNLFGIGGAKTKMSARQTRKKYNKLQPQKLALKPVKLDSLRRRVGTLEALRKTPKRTQKYGFPIRTSLGSLVEARHHNLEKAQKKLKELEDLLKLIYTMEDTDWFPEGKIETRTDRNINMGRGGRRHLRITRKSRNHKRRTQRKIT
jgi:hypothetical protein